MRRCPGLLVHGLLSLLLAASAAADGLFRANVTVGGATRSASVDALRDVPDLLDVPTLTALFPGWDPSQDFSATLDLRGARLPASWTAATATLALFVPGVAPVVFSEGSLVQDIVAVEDWLDGSFQSATAPEAALTALLQELVARSPVDPVAGTRTA